MRSSGKLTPSLRSGKTLRMTMLSDTRYVPRGANPTHVLALLNNLVTEFKASGIESVSIEELDSAIKAISR